MLAPQIDATSVEILHSLGDAIEVVRLNGSKLIRCRCGYQFGEASRNWKEAALKSIVSPREFGHLVKLHRDLEARQYLCPTCGILHSVEISLKKDPPLAEVELG